jgi:hypothetical protein
MTLNAFQRVKKELRKGRWFELDTVPLLLGRRHNLLKNRKCCNILIIIAITSITSSHFNHLFLSPLVFLFHLTPSPQPSPQLLLLNSHSHLDWIGKPQSAPQWVLDFILPSFHDIRLTPIPIPCSPVLSFFYCPVTSAILLILYSNGCCNTPHFQLFHSLSQSRCLFYYLTTYSATNYLYLLILCHSDMKVKNHPRQRSKGIKAPMDKAAGTAFLDVSTVRRGSAL